MRAQLLINQYERAKSDADAALVAGAILRFQQLLGIIIAEGFCQKPYICSGMGVTFIGTEDDYKIRYADGEEEITKSETSVDLLDEIRNVKIYRLVCTKKAHEALKEIADLCDYCATEANVSTILPHYTYADRTSQEGRQKPKV